ncbi:NAD(P)H-dependent oxidoreductase [Paludibacter jiangxiensis]|uniref:Putative NADPH-quinone reductase n=1 Tax=Paludibacter jiangxiensis TaxID=681398 RepID=A0A170ZM44_9BACT|nr:NAD(P)H-dependent oxidoreductase [Paludibacter jiangxiensis]GAT62812.1 putative NADPH-quinone reductase [Paludibacter jiangxiensis]
MKNILIINGHPDKESLCSALAKAYAAGVKESGAEYNLLHLADLQFNPILQHGYRKRTDLEPDLLMARELIAKADHLVFVYPIWWATEPALLKGFIDRTFLPGFAFQPRENSPLWDKLLTGKTAQLIVTMDAPKWYNALMYRNAGIVAFKKGILEYCGVKPVKVTAFGQVKNASEATRSQWLDKVKQLGRGVK